MLRALLIGACGLVPAAAAGVIVVPKDQPTIQAAVDAAVEGDTIEIRSGVYTEEIELSSKANLLITGTGKVRLVAPLERTALTLIGCIGVTLQKLRFEGPGVGLAINGSNLITVRKCRFERIDTGISAAGGAGLVIEKNVFKEMRDRAVLANQMSLSIADNKVQRSHHGFELIESTVQVTGNDVRDMVDRGIWVDSPPGDVDSSVTGNRIDRCGLFGIFCENVSMTTAQFSVAENSIKNVRHVGIGLYQDVIKLAIRKNTLRSIGNAAIRRIGVDPTEQVVILENNLRKIRGLGVDVQNSTVDVIDVALTDNVVLDTGLDGIRTNAATLSGNEVRDCGRFGVQCTGTDSGPDHMTLSGNVLLGSRLLDLFATVADVEILPDNTIGSSGP